MLSLVEYITQDIQHFAFSIIQEARTEVSPLRIRRGRYWLIQTMEMWRNLIVLVSWTMRFFPLFFLHFFNPPIFTPGFWSMVGTVYRSIFGIYFIRIGCR
jgi:hypothetical protein